jgi:hypothetical protein
VALTQSTLKLNDDSLAFLGIVWYNVAMITTIHDQIIFVPDLHISPGDMFGTLTVTQKLNTLKPVYTCECACGEIGTYKRLDLLRSKNLETCHHQQDKERARREKADRAKNILKGLSKLPEYRVWSDMRSRCNNSNHQVYRHYGGRGIKVCQKWQDSFIEFFKDMGPRQSKRFSIDRIDNDGNYEPENCKWSTMKQQIANQGNKHYTKKLIKQVKETLQQQEGYREEEYVLTLQ